VSEHTATLKAALPDDLKFVTVNAISAVKPDNQTVLDNYITAIERQDDLYDSAIKAIRSDLGLTTNANAEAVLESLTDGRRDYVFQYLTYIEKYLCFGKLPANTKITEIKTRPLIELLIKPEQVHNNFIREIASVCEVIKQNDGLFTKLKDSAYRESYARVCMATAEGNSYMLSLGQLRDGFFPSQKVADFRKIVEPDSDIRNTFWYKFITECVEDVDDKKEGERFHTIAARVFKAYKEASEDSKEKSNLRQTVLKTTMGKSVYFSLDDSHPFAKLMNCTIDGVTLENIFANVTLEELQFIVHLAAIMTTQPSSPETASPAELTAPSRIPESPSAPLGSDAAHIAAHTPPANPSQ
jgi:hypothetical protein